jgi:Ca2+-binding EF-hand superfamily protein
MACQLRQSPQARLSRFVKTTFGNDFVYREIEKLREAFGALDDDGSGSIGW